MRTSSSRKRPPLPHRTRHDARAASARPLRQNRHRPGQTRRRPRGASRSESELSRSPTSPSPCRPAARFSRIAARSSPHRSAEAVAALRAPAKSASRGRPPRHPGRVSLSRPGLAVRGHGRAARRRANPSSAKRSRNARPRFGPNFGLDLRDLLALQRRSRATPNSARRASRSRRSSHSATRSRGFGCRAAFNPARCSGTASANLSPRRSPESSRSGGRARLVAARARLVQELPRGAMLAARLKRKTPPSFSPTPARARGRQFPAPLRALRPVRRHRERSRPYSRSARITARRLATSHAFHSPMVEPVVARFAEAGAFASNSTRRRSRSSPASPANWLTAAEATDPQYWAHHLRATVRFRRRPSRACSRSAATRSSKSAPARRSRAARAAASAADRAHEVIALHRRRARRKRIARRRARPPVARRRAHRLAAAHRRRSASAASRSPRYPFERQRYFADLPAGQPRAHSPPPPPMATRPLTSAGRRFADAESRRPLRQQRDGSSPMRPEGDSRASSPGRVKPAPRRSLRHRPRRRAPATRACSNSASTRSSSRRPRSRSRGSSA